MKYYFGFLCSCAIFLAACQKEITVKLPQEEPRLVINSTTNTGDTIHVKVSQSVGVLEYSKGPALISNATVQLYADDVLSQVMPYDVMKQYYTSNVKAEAGKKYRIVVTAPSFTEVVGWTYSPVTVPIGNIHRTENVRIDDEHDTMDEFRITFDDPPSAGDYYIIKIIKTKGIEDSDPYFYRITSTDGSIESIASSEDPISAGTVRLSPLGVIVNDVLFNGQKKELVLYCEHRLLEPYQTTDEHNQPVTSYTYVELLHVTNDYYQYFKSYMAAKDNDNGFTQPINVFTNIANGYGIFSVMSARTVEVH